MALHRPALALRPGPRGVRDARTWVGEVCTDLDRPELLDSAQLAMSELVTNALLHGAAPIELRVRGTRQHPRLEVHDSSPEPPVLPTRSTGPTLDLDPDAPDELDLDALDLDALLMTVGRGLGIVARASLAWGADLEPDGKVVWFVPAAELAEDDGPLGTLTGDTPAPPLPDPVDPVTVRLHGVPPPAYAAFQRHLRELRREVRLLALAQESTYPLAADLADLFGQLELHLRDVVGADRVLAAAAAGRASVDLEVTMGRAATRSLGRFTDLLDLADEFCREERLLSLARTPEQRRFQRWLIGEFVQQGEGRRPVAWVQPDQARRSVVS